jgi:hypothetical protein
MNFQEPSLRACRAFVLTIAFVGALTLHARAQSMPDTVLSPGDRSLVTTLLQESRTQLALARLAEQRASGFVALSAANATITEWNSLRARLLQIAYAQGAPIRGTLDARQQAMLSSLGRTHRAPFNNVFLRDAQRGNQMAITRLQQDQNTNDSRVQRFVSFAQPIVSSYEQMTSDDLLGHQLRG